MSRRDWHMFQSSGFRLVDSGRVVEARKRVRRANERSARKAEAIMYGLAAACAVWATFSVLTATFCTH